MIDKNIKVLVVDDMLTMRKIVQNACHTLGFTNTILAENGEDAWKKINEDPEIRLVISDWNMPVCTGIDLLKRVRGNPSFADKVFVLVTAERDATQVTEAIRYGVDNYVVKPFTSDIFKQKLEAAFKKKAAA